MEILILGIVIGLIFLVVVILYTLIGLGYIKRINGKIIWVSHPDESEN